MKSLDKLQKDWENLARLDPLWAILSCPEKKFEKWNKEEFFDSGRNEISKLLDECKKLNYPKDQNKALDFGCGVGRLSRALGAYFKKVIGVDISSKMVELAKAYNNDLPNIEFQTNTTNELAYPNCEFSLIYSNIVLQHVPEKELILKYISEFVRTLKINGLLAFQLPHRITLRRKAHLRRKLYSILKMFGFKEESLYRKLNLHPMRMNSIPKEQIISFLESKGCKILKITESVDETHSIISCTYFLTKE